MSYDIAIDTFEVEAWGYAAQNAIRYKRGKKATTMRRVPYPSDFVDKVVGHEKKHIEHVEKWHDATLDYLNDLSPFIASAGSLEACKANAEGVLKYIKKRFRKMWWDEVNHEHEDFDNYVKTHLDTVITPVQGWDDSLVDPKGRAPAFRPDQTYEPVDFFCYRIKLEQRWLKCCKRCFSTNKEQCENHITTSAKRNVT